MFTTFFTCLGQIILKFEWKHRRPQTAKAILRKRRKIWRAQNQIDQWKRIENPETNSYIYCKLIISYLKKVKICKSVSSISNIRKTRELHVKKIEVRTLTSYAKINFKWIKNLKVRLDTI